ncbi:DUF4105 domain-containing protein [Parathalassolituus penaei]|uniref:DUF4105 domain-containing protein n=1 Tax=Parathalassolituus penaei TaxID=2997323 RepID=A0A9X3IT86_9GAMM|nr:DUF4105 domain-containing protein [Parathalassolituus penaei]MCY0966621.1 DUF4105 domain-containing protein [Parathalassolituus penaei]
MSIPVATCAEPTAVVITSQQAADLAASRQWQQLLHVRASALTGAEESRNRSPEFFLAADGGQDLAAELQADVSAFLQTGQAPDASAQCRFPARYHWLKQQLPTLPWQDQPCPEFEHWRDVIDAHALTLVFPASHINSPSSMYGHTLIRMDRAEGSSDLLAYSVNFAANADPDDNELVFSYKGLTGGYPGVVSVLPFMVKSREYRYMEYRDVIEYRLNLDQAEVDQFVRHTWELQNTWFDYYFFDENCSYRVLAMLDAASERLDTAHDFRWRTIPVDTVRALYQADAIESARYRPSASSQMLTMSEQALPGVISTAKQLVETDTDIETLLQALAAEQRLGQELMAQSQALELAHQYARYLSIRKKQGNPVLRARTIAMLSARSRRPPGIAFIEPEQPPVRDDQGHNTQRLQLALGETRSAGGSVVESGARDWLELGYRPAYHDILDPQPGFTEGAQIQMGHVRVRVSDGIGLRLQEFRVVDVLSLSERDEFFRPLSWGGAAGVLRPMAADGLQSFFDARFGYSWRLAGQARHSGVRGWALLNNRLTAGDELDGGWRLASGPELGLGGRWQLGGGELLGQLSGVWQPAWAGEDSRSRRLGLDLRWSQGVRWQLGLGWQRQLTDASAGTRAETESRMQWSWYF